MTAKQSRPRRLKKGDAIVSPDARAVEIACHHAVAPFDRAAIEMENKWGIDRLPEFVSPETAGKYGSAMGKLNDALNALDRDEVAARAAVCIRGLAAMNAEAEAAGHKPQCPEIWEIEIDGAKYGMIRDVRDWKLAEAIRPDLRILTLREAVVTFSAYSALPFINKTKDALPGAEITKVTPRPALSKDELNDPIPF